MSKPIHFLSEKGRSFWVSNGYGAISKKPFIKFEDADKKYELMMDVETARKIAGDILAACEAADQEGFLVGFIKQKTGCTVNEVAGILRDFRCYRQEQITDHEES